jgi:hypothetical protein
MIRNVKPALALLAALFFAVALNPSALAASGTNNGRVFSMTWYMGHNGLLVRQIGMTDLGGCGRSDYFILDRGHEHFKEIHALLLAAHMSDQDVAIDIGDCYQGLSRIRHVTSSR